MARGAPLRLVVSLPSISPASVVDDLPHNATNVTVLLSKVEVPKTSGVLVVVRVGLEDPTRLPLGTNNTLKSVCFCDVLVVIRTPMVCAVSKCFKAIKHTYWLFC